MDFETLQLISDCHPTTMGPNPFHEDEMIITSCDKKGINNPLKESNKHLFTFLVRQYETTILCKWEKRVHENMYALSMKIKYVCPEHHCEV